jgi:hypothetical protein
MPRQTFEIALLSAFSSRRGGHRAGEPTRELFGPVVLVPTLHQPLCDVGGGTKSGTTGALSRSQIRPQSKQVLVEMNPACMAQV